MARRKITQYFDDLDNSLLEPEDHREIQFSVDGKDYVLDLSVANAEKFDEALAPFVEVARPAAPESAPKASPSDIREWARKKGMDVASRGKIPQSVIQAYADAHK